MTPLEAAIADISPDFRRNDTDAKIMFEIVKHEATPEAVKMFAAKCRRLSHYGYWFLLGTLWVSYTGWNDLALWKQLFSSTRPNRKTSLMKPSEVAAFDRLPERVIAYRAHRPGETDWLSFTLSEEKAAMFASQRDVKEFAAYAIPKADALCLFLRRQEFELLMLDKSSAERVGTVQMKTVEEFAGGVE